MARFCDNTVPSYLEVSGNVVEINGTADPPFTMACWFRAADVTGYHSLMAVATQAASNHLHELGAIGSFAGDPVIAHSRSTGSDWSETTSGYSANTWHHAAGVWVASNDRSSYLDGGSKGTAAGTVTPTGMDVTQLGRRGNESRDTLARIAEAAIWNVALTDQEIAVLAAGVCPLLVRPLSIVAYWPLFGHADPEIDYGPNGHSLTLVNSPTRADHAPVSLWAPGFAPSMPVLEAEIGHIDLQGRYAPEISLAGRHGPAVDLDGRYGPEINLKGSL